jgi:hypothetical protein
MFSAFFEWRLPRPLDSAPCPNPFAVGDRVTWRAPRFPGDQALIARYIAMCGEGPYVVERAPPAPSEEIHVVEIRPTKTTEQLQKLDATFGASWFVKVDP